MNTQIYILIHVYIYLHIYIYLYIDMSDDIIN